jgi:hypothetical protein
VAFLTAGLLARRFAQAADPRRLLQPVARRGFARYPPKKKSRGWATEKDQFPNRDRPQASPHASPQQPMGHVFYGVKSTKNPSAAPLRFRIARPVSTAIGGPLIRARFLMLPHRQPHRQGGLTGKNKLPGSPLKLANRAQDQRHRGGPTKTGTKTMLRQTRRRLRTFLACPLRLPEIRRPFFLDLTSGLLCRRAYASRGPDSNRSSSYSASCCARKGGQTR